MTDDHRSQRGSALILALGFMVLVLIIAAGVHGYVVGQLQASGAQRQRVAADYLAQGALARTLGWFNSQGYQLPQLTTLNTTVPVTLAANGQPVVLPSNHPDSYTDILDQARDGVLQSYQSFMSGQSMGAGTYSVTASLISAQPETWEVLASADVGSTTRQAGALLSRQQDSLFSDALFGRDYAKLEGNAETDGYDSSLGPYGGSNRNENGHVRSNGDITLNGNATVKGNAMPGPNQNVTLNGNAEVTGLTDPAKTTKTLPAVTIPENAVDKGAVNLSGNAQQTYTAGTYKLTSLKISGNAQLIIDTANGPVNLYVTGKIKVSGNGIANTGGLPQSLYIAQVGGSTVKFSGNADFAGTVYAPDSALKLTGNGEMYGSFVGKSLTVSGNGSFHHDQALQAVATVPGPLRLVAQWSPPSS